MRKPKKIPYILDAHNDTLLKLVSNLEQPEDPFFIRADTSLNINWARIVKASIDGCFYAAFSSEQNISLFDKHQHVYKMFLVLERLTAYAKVHQLPFYWQKNLCNKQPTHWHHSAFLTIEGAYALTEANALHLIDQYKDYGVVAMAPVWNQANIFGGGADSENDLTPIGRLMLERMENQGIIIDVSHMNEATFWSTLMCTNTPLIASHSGAYALVPHQRNLKDDQLQAIANTNGLVNVVFHKEFINRQNLATLENVVDHILYIGNLIGFKHVGIGSDFDGCDTPTGLENIERIPTLYRALLKRGLSEKTCCDILGGNLLTLIKTLVKPHFSDFSDRVTSSILPLHHSITGEIIEHQITFTTHKPLLRPLLLIDGIQYKPQMATNLQTRFSIPSSSPPGYHLMTLMDSSNPSHKKTNLIYL